jgi:hypothetical protein
VSRRSFSRSQRPTYVRIQNLYSLSQASLTDIDNLTSAHRLQETLCWRCLCLFVYINIGPNMKLPFVPTWNLPYLLLLDDNLHRPLALEALLAFFVFPGTMRSHFYREAKLEPVWDIAIRSALRRPDASKKTSKPRTPSVTPGKDFRIHQSWTRLLPEHSPLNSAMETLLEQDE